jgi:hypothetical protein
MKLGFIEIIKSLPDIIVQVPNICNPGDEEKLLENSDFLYNFDADLKKLLGLNISDSSPHEYPPSDKEQETHPGIFIPKKEKKQNEHIPEQTQRIPSFILEDPASIKSSNLREKLKKIHRQKNSLKNEDGIRPQVLENEKAKVAHPFSSGISKEQYAENQNIFSTCSVCTNRLSYKPNYQKGKIPLAIIHNNPERYRWDSYYPRDMVANKYFSRMFLNVLRMNPQDFYHLELLGCNFPADTENLSGEVIAEYIQNCRSFILDYLDTEKIEAVIIMSEAANFLFGKDNAKKMIKNFIKGIYPPYSGIIIRSPIALSYLERNKRNTELIHIMNEIKDSLQLIKEKFPRYFS